MVSPTPMSSDFRELASVDGTVTSTAEATVPLKDDGLYRGDGAFEVIRLYQGRPFALGDHLDRLGRSAAALELEFDRGALETEIEALLSEFGVGDGQLRLIVTRGGRRIAATEPIPPHAESVGVATVTYSPNVILNGVKSLSYAANMEATRIAKGRGADEAVLVRPDGIVLEPPTSSIFWVSAGGGLRTTALNAPVLESITRDRLVRALEVEEGEWPVTDLRGAGEAFLASTTREIQAVSAIDGVELAAAPGPRTAEAQEAFRTVLDEELQ
jgi:branched-chain amino acid aminotransferase